MLTPVLVCLICAAQEEGNIPYVIDNGVGTFEKQPAKIADIVVDWFGEGAEAFKEMAVKAKALGRPEVSVQTIQQSLQTSGWFRPFTLGKHILPILPLAMANE